MLIFRARTVFKLLAVVVLALFLIVMWQRPWPQQSRAPAPTLSPRVSATSTTAARPLPTPLKAAAVHPTPSPEPFPSRLAARHLAYVPILMYHYIRTVDKKQDPVGFRLSVTPERFDEQMAWLRKHRYTPIRMDALARCMRRQAPCPRRPVVLTFDDGYADSATAALPILKRYGFVATFFVIVDFIGKPGFLSWDQVKLLRDSGMEIGSHTLSHADLTGLSAERAEYEIVRSRAMLEQRLAISIESFCYPAGSFTAQIAEMVRTAGYTSAVITSPKSAFNDMYTLSRRRVLGGETIDGFKWYLAPAEAQAPK